jgi:hypothetical protein
MIFSYVEWITNFIKVRGQGIWPQYNEQEFSHPMIVVAILGQNSIITSIELVGSSYSPTIWL